MLVASLASLPALASPPPLPAAANSLEAQLEPDAGGGVAWIDEDADRSMSREGSNCAGPQLSRVEWNVRTDSASRRPLSLGGPLLAQIALSGAQAVLAVPGCKEAEASIVSRSGASASVRVPHAVTWPRLIALSATSFAIVDHDLRSARTRVDVVRLRDGALFLDTMPDLPRATLDDAAELGLADGRLMVLGGSKGQYRGCLVNDCSADTWILEPSTKRWLRGPQLLEPVANPAVVSMLDGGVLVAGGWTTEGGGHRLSRTVERLNPKQGEFERAASLPAATAFASGSPLASGRGQALLVSGGIDPAVQAYDVDSDTWRVLGSQGRAGERGSCLVMPFAFEGRSYLWTSSRPSPGDSLCKQGAVPELVALLRSDGAPVEVREISACRIGAAFVAQAPGAPALLIGGGWGRSTAAVDAFDLDHRAAAMPVLEMVRRGATAMRIGGGVLVTGQGAGDAADGPLTEWLADARFRTAARWQAVGGWGLTSASVVGPDASGGAIELAGSSAVNRLKFDASMAQPMLQREALQPLRRGRRAGGADDGIRVRGLADGRVVVAGGRVRSARIAVMAPDSSRPDAADEFVEVGDFLPSRRHEIYDPQVGRWHDSAPSKGGGGTPAILDDGRVVKVGHHVNPGSVDTYEIEISSADGRTWRNLSTSEDPWLVVSADARPFTIDGELFLAGAACREGDSSARCLAWMDQTTERWRILWRGAASPSTCDDLGRLVEVRLQTGRRILVPTEGGVP